MTTTERKRGRMRGPTEPKEPTGSDPSPTAGTAPNPAPEAEEGAEPAADASPRAGTARPAPEDGAEARDAESGVGVDVDADPAEVASAKAPVADAAVTPAAGEGAESDAGSAAEPGAGEGRGRARRWRLGLPRGLRRSPGRAFAVAGVVVLLLAGGGFGYAAQQLDDPGAARNRALTDTEATSRVIGDVSNALSRIFAYTPDDLQSTAQAARDSLEGAAAGQYQQLFARIREQVAVQHLTLSTRVVRAGVVSLTGDRAELLVFLDQTAERTGAAPTTAAAQLSVSAHLVGGHWRISALKAR